MNITTERMADSQILLTIEVDPDRVEKSMDQAYRRVAPRIRVPGFRPGKAPRRVLERHVGRAALLEEALEKLVPEIVAEAIEHEAIAMAAVQPTVEITSVDPVVIKATVPLRPTVELGAYRELRLAPAPVEVDEEQVAQSVEGLRARYADIEPVERPVEENDRVRLTLLATAGDEVVRSEEDAEIVVKPDELADLPGLFERLIGMSAGESAVFDVEPPAATPDAEATDALDGETVEAEEDVEETVTSAGEAPEAAETTAEAEDGEQPSSPGRTIHYAVTIHDVKAEVLPEADDEFAKEVGEGFASMEALRERLRTDLRERAEAEAKQKFQEDALTALIEGATIEFPPQLIDHEVEHMVEEAIRPMVGNDQRAMDRFMQQVGRSLDTLREGTRPAAIDRIKRTLALSTLAEREAITVSDEDVEGELSTLISTSSQPQRMIEVFGSAQGKLVLRQQLHSRRTVERLTAIVSGEAPPLPEPAATLEEGETPAAQAGDDAPLTATEANATASPEATAAPETPQTTVLPAEAQPPAPEAAASAQKEAGSDQ